METSPRKGRCATCGAKNVVTTAPPNARCADRKKCEENMAENRDYFAKTGKPLQ